MGPVTVGNLVLINREVWGGLVVMEDMSQERQRGRSGVGLCGCGSGAWGQEEGQDGYS